MTHRLLLGSGTLITQLAQSLHGQPGILEVGTTDSSLANSLRDRGISVEEFEQMDREALSRVERPEIVGVFDEDHQRNQQLTKSVRAAFPDAQLIVYAGWAEDRRSDQVHKTGGTGSETVSATVDTIADQVVDPGEEIADQITARVGDSGQRIRQLQQVLRDIDNLAVVTHDNPDPDALASALALSRIARATGTHPEVCYYGEITHQENRAMVNVLEIELRNLEPDEDLAEFDGIALVDHSRPSVNDQLPTNMAVDIVIDHHPPRSPVNARFVDLRSNVGATSTLLVDYLDRFNIPIEEELATALLFGIHVDTQGFSREMSQDDFTAGARLVKTANFGMLERIESPSISPQTFRTIADAITNRQVEGSALLSCVGELSERDALAQAADRLLNLENISTVLVYGIMDGVVFISARARGTDIDLGETLREAFGQVGSAGGHVDMAGAQIELGVLESIEDRNESLRTVVEEFVSSRFLDEFERKTNTAIDNQYMTEAELDAEYLGEELASRSTETATDWAATEDDDANPDQ